MVLGLRLNITAIHVEVAVFIDAFRDEDYTFSIVPVEQAIMIPDSDVRRLS
jgi:hypothetical protein